MRAPVRVRRREVGSVGKLALQLVDKGELDVAVVGVGELVADGLGAPRKAKDGVHGRWDGVQSRLPDRIRMKVSGRQT